MDIDDMTFLEQPLDRDLYKRKTFIEKRKKPMRVLILDSGSKIAYNLIYLISMGNVFGPDQDLILHLLYSKGTMHPKAVVSEILECGFHVVKDYIISCNPAIAYRKVDVIIQIASYEEIVGCTPTSSLLYHLMKARQAAKYIQSYAKENAKLIFTGPSTKAAVILLAVFQKFSGSIKRENVSCAVFLDVVLGKSLLAAKLKTTTDKIKNVYVWGATVPDVCNATVEMYPPNDRGCWEKKDIPIVDALRDDQWLYTNFIMSVYRRVMNPDLLKHGKAVAKATAMHIEALFRGSDRLNELPSMGVVNSTEVKNGLPPGFAYAMPVHTKDGIWEIRDDVKIDTQTKLNILRCIFNYCHSFMSIPVNSIVKIISLMLDYNFSKTHVITSKFFRNEVIDSGYWAVRYFLTPNPAGGMTNFGKDEDRYLRKSIAWDDDVSDEKINIGTDRSSIKFKRM